MISPISNAQASYANEASLPPPNQQSQHESSALPQDTVTLKSAGDVDHDGDSH